MFLLSITLAIAGVITSHDSKVKFERHLTYFNPIFATTILPVTRLADVIINKVKDVCISKENNIKID